MPWSAEFGALLEQTTIPGLRFVLRPIAESLLPGSLTVSLQRVWIVASSPQAGATIDGLIGPGGGVGGSEVRPPDWSSSIGTLTIPIADPSDRLLANVRRGQWVELLCGAPGWDLSRYQRIAMGVVQNLVGSGVSASLEVRDVLAGLGSRPTTTATEYALFSGSSGTQVGSTTTLTSTFTVIAGTVPVVSTANFGIQEDGSTSLHGALLVTPTTGDPFYIHWYIDHGVGLPAASFPVSTSSTHGTTRVEADSGDTVTECALVTGHPAEIAAKLLVSRGGSLVNGPYDVLPRTWAYGLHRSLIDEADIARTVAATQPSSGADDWELLSEQEQTDGAAWVAQMLARGGYFLALRQGSITVRHAPALDDAVPTRVITDDDIASVETWEVWDGDYSVQYRTVTVQTDGTNYSTTGTINTMPVEESIEYDLRDHVFANHSPIAVEVRTRMRGWATRIPEKVVMRLRGLHWSQYAPGDVLALTTRSIRRRGGGAFDRAVGLVCSVSPDWLGAPETTVTMRFLPPDGV